MIRPVRFVYFVYYKNVSKFKLDFYIKSLTYQFLISIMSDHESQGESVDSQGSDDKKKSKKPKIDKAQEIKNQNAVRKISKVVFI